LRKQFTTKAMRSYCTGETRVGSWLRPST